MKKILQAKSVRLAILISMLTLLIQYFIWDLADIVTVFLIIPIIGLCYLTLGVAFVVAMINGFRHRKSTQHLVVTCIYTATLLLLIFFPWTRIWLKINYITHYQVRQEVIEEIKKGTLKNNVSYNKIRIDLPDNLKNASKGGYVLVNPSAEENREILFFTFAGVLDNYSGYLYTESDIAPTKFLSDDLVQTIKAGDNWYFIASN